ncbi:MAG: transcription termination factor NusA [Aquificae bacterium]|nr:transcription termination factor NusA [Aquificota bacterium]
MVKSEIEKLIEQVAKEHDVPEKIVEKALKNAIAIAIKRDKGIREELEVDFTDEGIKVYTVKRQGNKKLKFPLNISPEDVNRIAAFAAKEEFFRQLERAEQERGFLEYKELEGEIVYGRVRKKLEGEDLLVDLGKIDGVLPKREQIPTEHYEVGDSVKALLLEVRKLRGFPYLVLSRTHPGFLKKLLEQEVPEIQEGLIEVKAVARVPGERAKVAVDSREMRMDPVGIVVGLKGTRIQKVSEELSGEKIDVIRWSDEPEELIKRALSPAHPVKVKLFPHEKRAEVAVPDEELSLAIGRKGVNVRLASKLTGWHIDVLSLKDFEKLEELRKKEHEGEESAEAQD